MPSLRIKRGTRAQLDAAAAADQLLAGEQYLITGEERLAVGVSSGRYREVANGFPDPEVFVRPGLGVNTLYAFGTTLTTTGTATARSMGVTGSVFRNIQRVGLVSAATANSSAGVRDSAFKYMMSGAGFASGGFAVEFGFRIADQSTAVGAGGRVFVGLASSTVPLSGDPSQFTAGLVGIGADSGATTLSILSNNGAGGAGAVALGADFPVWNGSFFSPETAADLYILQLAAAPGSGDLSWRVVRLSDSGGISAVNTFEASGLISGTLPGAGTFLVGHLWRNNGGVASASGIDLCWYSGKSAYPGRLF